MIFPPARDPRVALEPPPPPVGASRFLLLSTCVRSWTQMMDRWVHPVYGCTQPSTVSPSWRPDDHVLLVSELVQCPAIIARRCPRFPGRLSRNDCRARRFLLLSAGARSRRLGGWPLRHLTGGAEAG